MAVDTIARSGSFFMEGEAITDWCASITLAVQGDFTHDMNVNVDYEQNKHFESYSSVEYPSLITCDV